MNRNLLPLWRLAVAVGISLALHAALLLGFRVGQVERPGASVQPLQVKLMEVTHPAEKKTDKPPVLVRAIDQPAPENKPVPEAMPKPGPKPEPPKLNGNPPDVTQPEKAAAKPEKAGMPEQAAGATTLDIPLPEDSTYYPAREVDDHPVLVSGGRPVYPEKAGRNHIYGEVTVLMMLNENGTADEVSIVEAKPAGMGFEEAVIAWLQNARFKPAMRKGRAVKARVVYHVTFEP